MYMDTSFLDNTVRVTDNKGPIVCNPFVFNPFMPTVPTFAVRETDVSRHNGGTAGVTLKPPRDDSALFIVALLVQLLVYCCSSP